MVFRWHGICVPIPISRRISSCISVVTATASYRKSKAQTYYSLHIHVQALKCKSVLNKPHKHSTISHISGSILNTLSNPTTQGNRTVQLKRQANQPKMWPGRKPNISRTAPTNPIPHKSQRTARALNNRKWRAGIAPACP